MTVEQILQVLGDYELVEKIAEGGMGAVFKGRNLESEELVAIKILPPHLAKNQVLLKRFEQEYNAASILNHPNIVRALAFGYDGDSPYLVMEYVEGETLGTRLERDGAMSENEAIKVIAQVAQGLHKAHKQGLVHRDVKPDNVLITPDNQVKLADLGLVKELDTDLNLTRTGRGLGTPHFMAPEQFRDAKNADIRCDIYSLGATLYMMVTGELPFKSSGPLEAWMKKVENKITPARELAPHLSERVDWAIRRSMSPDRDQRPRSCREFVEDITGQSTKRISPEVVNTIQETWYLRYKDEEGVSHTVKGNMASIRRSLKEGLLGDAANIRASKNKSGPFENLKNLPEFRDLVLSLTCLLPKPPKAKASPTYQPSPDFRKAKTPATPISQPKLPSYSNSAKKQPTPPAKPTPPASPLPELPGNFDPNPAPLIDLEPVKKGFDWGKLLLFIVFAVAAGIAGFYFLPYLLRSKLFNL